MSQSDLKRARACRDTDRWDEALTIAAAALSLQGDPSAWLTFALEIRDQRRPVEAEQFLRLIIDKCANYSPAYYELAFMLRLRGEHRQSIGLLEAALRHDWPPFRTRVFLAHMLFAQGAFAEGVEALNATVAASERDRQALDAMFAFGRYIRNNPLGRTLFLLDRLRAQRTWLDPRSLADDILNAIGERRPFAMVRFGDGEGGVLSLDAEDEALHRPLYEQNRNELIAMWFGREFPWRSNGFFELASKLINEVLDCDVIGVPYGSWIEHEYRISSLRGIPSLTNVFHALAASKQAAFKICSQIAHVDLATNGDLAKIIKQAGAISVISCLDGLTDMLKQRFDLSDVAFHRIPGEQGSRTIIGPAATQGVHYPDRFQQLMAELARPQAGRVYLIAGGLLGKLYAAQIRRHGGIAIDVGSIVDSWMGHATRPGYQRPVGL